MATRRNGGKDGDRKGDDGRKIELSRGLFVALVAALVLLATALWSVKSRDHAHVRPASGGPFADLLPSIASLTQSTLVDGNRVDVLQDEAFFDALLVDIGRARQSVTFETYVWWKGDVCRRLAEALAARAREGVEVRALLDAFGSLKMDEELLELMRQAGVRVEQYHPLSMLELEKYDNRDHRKIAVIDGRVGFVFGHGIAHEWTAEALEGEKPHPPWRDTALRLEGPVVAQLQSVFMENWMEVAEEVPYGEDLFPDLEPAGEVTAHVVRSSPHGSMSSVELLYKIAIATAQEEILVQNPYFVPDPDVVELFVEAAERGVRVRIMVPGEGSDSPLALHAGHTYYETLLAGGVEIWEYRPTLLHQKVMVVDGLWAHVGSTNFDARSLEINDEVSVGVVDERIGRELAAAFAKDLADCTPIRPGWQRSLWHRMIDRAAYLVQEQI